jgi:hypothetical protein
MRRRFSKPRVGLLVHDLVVLVLGDDLALLEAGLARLDHHVRLVVEDALEVADAHVEQVADARRHALEEPDVRHRHRQLDVSEPLAPHLGLGDLDAAAVAHDAPVADALVLAAVALPVLHRAEDLLAEQPVLLRLERAVIDGLRLRDLAVRPAPDHVRGREPDADLVEAQLATLVAVLEAAEPHAGGRRVQRRLQVGVLDHVVSSNWTSRHRLWSSFTSTLKDSGVPGSGGFSPFTIAS